MPAGPEEVEQRGEGPGAAFPAHARDWALFLDIDGTLLGIAEHPGAVTVDRPLVSLLGRLQAAAGGAVALISGRTVADIDRLFAPLELAVAGQHGLERRDAQGRMHRQPMPVTAMENARAQLARLARTRAGVWVEDKGASLALHYRAAPQLGPELAGLVGDIVAGLGQQFELQPGKMVLEVKPGGRDKGTAIAEFMQERPFLGRTPVFIGDDHTDEFGFALVNRTGGHSVKVGEGASAARWRLPDALAVRTWLEKIAASSAAAHHLSARLPPSESST